MAKIGLKYMVCAEIEETEEAGAKTVTYKPGMVMGKAITAGINIDLKEAKLYADDMVVESIKEFGGGKLNLNAADFDVKVTALILGHKKEALTAPETAEVIISSGGDDGANVGVGFYSTVIRGGVRKYRAIWLQKIKFGEPNESLETKGENINFQTPTIEGTLMQDILGVWKKEVTFAAEESAVTWLNTQAGITE